MERVSCLLAVLLFCIGCAFGSGSTFTLEPRDVQEVANLPYTGLTELTPSSPVSGTLRGTPNSTASYIYNLAAGEQATFITYTGASANNLGVVFYLVGSSRTQSSSLDYYVGINNLTHGRCPANAATYFFTLTSSVPLNYTIQIQKSQSVLAYNTVNSGTSVYGVDKYHWAIPSSSKCKTMAISASMSYSATVNLNFNCYSSDNTCTDIGIPQFPIATANQYDGVKKAYVYDIYLNCTAVGNYYLNINAYNYNPLSYNITVVEKYPCPDWCLGRGTCDFATANCTCTSTYPGDRCGVTSKRDTREVEETEEVVPFELRTEEREIFANTVPYDIIVDGQPHNYSNPVTLGSGSNDLSVVRLTPSAPNKVLRVIMAVQRRPNYESRIYAYFNPNSPPSYPSNYTSSDGVYVYRTNYGSGPQYPYYTMETHLVGTVSAWYIGFRDGSNPNQPMPDITFTVTEVDTAIGSSRTFSEVMSPYNQYNSNNQQFAVAVKSFTAPQDGYVYFRVDEDVTTPYLMGIYGITKNPAAINSAFSQGSTDGNPFLNHYQIATQVLSGTTYYVSIVGKPGVNYSGRIDFTTTSANCGTGKCLRAQGICTYDSTCVCRYGYKGDGCTQVDAGASAIQLFDAVTVNVSVTGGVYSQGAIQNLISPIVPSGYNLYFTVNSTTSNKIALWYGTALPNPYSSPYTVDTNGKRAQSFTNCVPRVDTNVYATIAGFNASLDVTADVTATLRNVQMPADGTLYTFNDLPYYEYFPVQVTFPTCADAYYVTVAPINNTLINQVYAGCPACLTCCTANTNLQKDPDTGIYSGIFTPTNCSWGLDIRIYGAIQKGQAGITVLPTKACPKNCNGYGTCALGGICQCTYPYTGEDCSGFDNQNSAITNSLTTCKGNYPMSYGGQKDVYSLAQRGCEVKYMDQVEIPNYIQDIANTLSFYSFTLSTSCASELKQIFCSYNFQRQNITNNGTKVYLPCNCKSFVDRCVTGYPSSLGELSNLCSNVNYYMTGGNSLGNYQCDPNVVLGKQDPVVTTGKINGNAGSGNGNGNGGNGGNGNNGGSSTTTTGAASGLVVVYSLTLLVSVVLCFTL